MRNRRSLRRLPAVIVALLSGALIVFAALLPGLAALQTLSMQLLAMARLLGGFLLLAAAVGFLLFHVRRITVDGNGLTRHAAVVVGFLLMVIPGLFLPVDDGQRTALPTTVVTSSMLLVMEQVYVPIATALFALPAYFTLQAMIDALRSRRPASLIVVVTAGVLLLVPLLPLTASPAVGSTAQWFEAYVVTPTVRALLLSSAIAALVAGVRVLVGRDQPYAEQDR